MLYLIILAVCSAFIAFFALLEVRYFGLFPLFFLILFFSQGFGDFKLKLSETDLTQKYGLYALGLLVFFGIFGILNFIGLSYQSAFFMLLLLCWGLWYGSYFLEYEDGKGLFKYGFLLILFLLLGDSFFHAGMLGFSGMFGMTILLAVLGFGGLWYGVGSFRTIENEHQHFFLFAVFLGILDALFLSISVPLYALNLDLLVYFIVMLMLTRAFRFTPLEQAPMRRELSLRRILAGEKILAHQKQEKKSGLISSFSFFKTMPPLIKYLLEYLNVALLIGVLIAYLVSVFQNTPLQQWWYWSGIAFFLANAFLLKKNQMFSLVSRFAVALIINFSLYISLIVFGEGPQTMLPWLIAWNLLCGVLVFYTRFPLVKAYVKKADVVFWLLTSLVAMLLNIVLLMRLSLSGQLIFSLIFFYLGVQGTIAYYAMQLIRNYSLPQDTELGGIKKTDPLDLLLEKEVRL